MFHPSCNALTQQQQPQYLQIVIPVQNQTIVAPQQQSALQDVRQLGFGDKQLLIDKGNDPINQNQGPSDQSSWMMVIPSNQFDSSFQGRENSAVLLPSGPPSKSFYANSAQTPIIFQNQQLANAQFIQESDQHIQRELSQQEIQCLMMVASGNDCKNQISQFNQVIAAEPKQSSFQNQMNFSTSNENQAFQIDFNQSRKFETLRNLSQKAHRETNAFQAPVNMFDSLNQSSTLHIGSIQHRNAGLPGFNQVMCETAKSSNLIQNLQNSQNPQFLTQLNYKTELEQKDFLKIGSGRLLVSASLQIEPICRPQSNIQAQISSHPDKAIPKKINQKHSWMADKKDRQFQYNHLNVNQTQVFGDFQLKQGPQIQMITIPERKLQTALHLNNLEDMDEKYIHDSHTQQLNQNSTNKIQQNQVLDRMHTSDANNQLRKDGFYQIQSKDYSYSPSIRNLNANVCDNSSSTQQQQYCAQNSRSNANEFETPNNRNQFNSQIFPQSKTVQKVGFRPYTRNQLHSSQARMPSISEKIIENEGSCKASEISLISKQIEGSQDSFKCSPKSQNETYTKLCMNEKLSNGQQMECEHSLNQLQQMQGSHQEINQISKDLSNQEQSSLELQGMKNPTFQIDQSVGEPHFFNKEESKQIIYSQGGIRDKQFLKTVEIFKHNQEVDDMLQARSLPCGTTAKNENTMHPGNIVRSHSEEGQPDENNLIVKLRINKKQEDYNNLEGNRDQYSDSELECPSDHAGTSSTNCNPDQQIIQVEIQQEKLQIGQFLAEKQQLSRNINSAQQRIIISKNREKMQGRNKICGVAYRTSRKMIIQGLLRCYKTKLHIRREMAGPAPQLMRLVEHNSLNSMNKISVNLNDAQRETTKSEALKNFNLKFESPHVMLQQAMKTNHVESSSESGLHLGSKNFGEIMMIFKQRENTSNKDSHLQNDLVNFGPSNAIGGDCSQLGKFMIRESHNQNRIVTNGNLINLKDQQRFCLSGQIERIQNAPIPKTQNYLLNPNQQCRLGKIFDEGHKSLPNFTVDQNQIVLPKYKSNLNSENDQQPASNPFKLSRLSNLTLRYEVIYKNLLRDLRKFYIQEVTKLTPYSQKKRRGEPGFYQQCLREYLALRHVDESGPLSAEKMCVTFNELEFCLGALISPKEMLRTEAPEYVNLACDQMRSGFQVRHDQQAKKVIRVYQYLYRFSIERLKDLIYDAPFVKLFQYYYYNYAKKRFASTPTLRKYLDAYIEASDKIANFDYFSKLETNGRVGFPTEKEAPKFQKLDQSCHPEASQNNQYSLFLDHKTDLRSIQTFAEKNMDKGNLAYYAIRDKNDSAVEMSECLDDSDYTE
ncbi:hypothetical protein FGO68_gene16829 [Halteria grandinella]|uniref:Uncharacterized protein n=1 Tax=Halteria grandinella TaxID=5974 RepID=A0A8J8P5T6_HALGN|nr:hypothetical protein FGO68_gene16829 [Halteria grandinella]